MTDASDGKEPCRDQSESIDWYAEGQVRTVEVGEARVVIRFIGRKGRRARISIAAPAGAVFSSSALPYSNRRDG